MAYKLSIFLIFITTGFTYAGYYDLYVPEGYNLPMGLDSVMEEGRDDYTYLHPGNPSFPLPTQNFNPEDAFLPTSKEWVDLASGNLMINDPLVHFKGRNGLDLDVILTYNSGFWRYEGPWPRSNGYGSIPSLTLQWCGLGWDIIMGELHIATYRPTYDIIEHLPEYSSISIPSASIRSRVIKGKLIGDNTIEYRVENNPDWRIIQNPVGYGYIAISPAGLKYYFARCVGRYRWYDFYYQDYMLKTNCYFLTKIEDSNGNNITANYIFYSQTGYVGTEYDDQPPSANYASARLLQKVYDTKGDSVRFMKHDHSFMYGGVERLTPVLDSIKYWGFNAVGNTNYNTIKFEYNLIVDLYQVNQSYNGYANLLTAITYRDYGGNQLQPPKRFLYDVFNNHVQFGNIENVIYPTAKYYNSNAYAGRRDYYYVEAHDAKMTYRRVSWMEEIPWAANENRINYYFGDNSNGNTGWDNNDITNSSIVRDYAKDDGYRFSVASYKKTKVYYEESGNYDIYYFLDSLDIAGFYKRKPLWGTCWKIEHYNSFNQLIAKEEYGYDLTKEGQSILHESYSSPEPWAYKQLRGEYQVKGNSKIFTRYDNYTKYSQWKTKIEYGFISYFEWGSYFSNPYVVDAGNDKRTTTRSFLWESNSNYVTGSVFLIDRVALQQLKDNSDNLVSQVQYEYDSPGYNDYYNYYSMYPSDPPAHHTTQGQYRGNLTKFKQGLQEGSQWNWITTYYKYDICGNMVRSIDQLGHETSYRYDVDFGNSWPYDPDAYEYTHLRKKAAYIGSDSLCEGVRWLGTQGLVVSYFGPNSSGTRTSDGWHYWYCGLNRLCEINAPDEHYWIKYFTYFVGQTSSATSYNSCRVWSACSTVLGSPLGYGYNNQDYLYDYLGKFFQYQRWSPYCINGVYDTTWCVNHYYDEKGLKSKVSKQFRGPLFPVPIPTICWAPMVNGYTEYKYDAINRMSELTFPPGTSENDRIHYGYTDNTVTVTDENDNVRRYTYDAYGRVSKVELDLNNQTYTTEYQYDALGNLTQVSVNNGSYVITYIYDSMGRLIQKNDPNTGTTKYVYDDVGNQRFIQDANHATGSNWVYRKYDAVNRLTEEGEIYSVNPGRTEANNPSYPSNGSWRVKRYYDYSYYSSTNPKGNLVRELISEDGGTCKYMMVYSYDKRGRITKKVRFNGETTSGGLKISYEYDAQDNLIKIVYPDSEATTYKLNGLMLCDTVKTAGNQWLAKIRYRENEKPSYIYVRNSTTHLTYYPRDWIQSGYNEDFFVNYFYDNVGSVINAVNSGYNASYAYDDLYRLTNETYTGNYNTQISYSYDCLHNRILANKDGTPINYQYTPNTSRLIKVGTMNCNNDANGNMTSFNRYTNTYNYRNELIRRRCIQLSPDIAFEDINTDLVALDVLDPVESITSLEMLETVAEPEILETLANMGKIKRDDYTYLYDGNGNRHKMVHNNAVTHYICDESGRVIFETDDTPNLLKNPNFENGSVWAPWYTYTPSGSCTWTVVSDTVKGGFYTIRGTSKTDNYESFIQRVQFADCPAPFVASVYVKTRSFTGGIKLTIDFYNGSTFLGSKASSLVSGTNNWLQIILPVYSSDIPSGTNQMNIFVRKYAGTGTCWIDGFRVEGGSTPTPNDCKYIYVNNTHLAKIDALGEPYFYMCDALGTPRMIRDKNGAMIRADAFYAFGEQLGYIGQDFPNTHRFTGKEREESGIDYFGARYYMPEIGRFITADPLGKFEQKDPKTINPFVYCTNNPLRYIDPNGKWRDNANAVAFVNAAQQKAGTSYGSGDYPNKLDCTGLVKASLSTVADQGVKTQLLNAWGKIGKAPRGGSMATGILDAAKAGENNLGVVEQSDMQVGDLIVVEGHAEIVASVVNKEGTITTVAASSTKGEVTKRTPFNPWDKDSWWQKDAGRPAPTVVRITEEKKEDDKNVTP